MSNDQNELLVYYELIFAIRYPNDQPQLCYLITHLKALHDEADLLNQLCDSNEIMYCVSAHILHEGLDLQSLT